MNALPAITTRVYAIDRTDYGWVISSTRHYNGIAFVIMVTRESAVIEWLAGFHRDVHPLIALGIYPPDAPICARPGCGRPFAPSEARAGFTECEHHVFGPDADDPDDEDETGATR